MRKLFVFLLLGISVLSYSQNKSQGYLINGSLSGVKAPMKAYLYLNGQLDSVSVVNGKFDFKGTVDGIKFATLILNHESGVNVRRNRDVRSFYVENKSIRIVGTDSLKTADIKGSVVNDEWKEYQSDLSPIEKKYEALNQEYSSASEEKKKDEGFQKYINDKSDSIDNEARVLNLDFLKKHSNYYISLIRALPGYVGYSPDAKEAESAFVLLSENLKNSKEGKEYAKNIANWKLTGIGAQAPDFSLPDTLGNQVKLSGFKGKYLLLDFWASWCRPCRHENPNVVKTYNEYKDKNFTILGVSLDSEKANWLKAIENDQLGWNHVSDLKGWKSAAAQLYAVQAIPANFLIDPSGKIIAKNLRGEDLAKTLEKYLH